MNEVPLQDAVIRQALEVMRLAASAREGVDAALRALETDLRTLLRGEALSDAGKAAINELIDAAKQAIEGRYSLAQAVVDTRQLALVVAERTLEAVKQIIPELRAATVETIASLTSDVLIEGAPSSAWWRRQSQDTAFRFVAELRRGVVNGEPNERIVARIVGPTGLLQTSRRNARTLVQSSIMNAANHARLATYRKNSRLIRGVRQISTLDGHTSDICIAYSGGTWDLEGNPIDGWRLPFNGGPPRHWACRSILSPIPKTFRDIGINVNEPSRIAERASSLGPIAGDTSFADFLKRQPATFADQVLGKGRADLWRAGKITLSQLVDGTGNPLTLDQLKAL